MSRARAEFPNGQLHRKNHTVVTCLIFGSYSGLEILTFSLALTSEIIIIGSHLFNGDFSMHTFVHEPTGMRFHHNPDLSGDILVTQPDWPNGYTMVIPGDALLAFVAEFLRNERARQLDNMTHAEILGISPRLTGEG
jgi:hypothetical protein